MKLDKTQRKVCFTVSQDQHDRVNALPRSFNLSELLRRSLDNILESQSSSIGDDAGSYKPAPPKIKNR